MIEIRDLALRRGHFGLQDIGLRVEAGECLVLAGPSGAGKTLLLETILGIHEPERGQVLVGGEDVTRRPPERRGFSYVPQDLALFPHLGVFDNVAFSRRGRGPNEELERAVQEAAGWLCISHLLARRSILGLSGGEKQRVALARALVAEPRVLFLDEPFNSLDAALRRDLVRELAELRRRIGLTTVLVTHEPDEMFVLGDRMALLLQGRILQVGAPEEVWRRPATLDAARLLLVENLLPVDGAAPGRGPGLRRYRSTGLEIEGPAPAEEAAGPLWLGIRAQHVRIVGEGEGGFRARILRIQRRADRWSLSVRPEAWPEGSLEIALGDAGWEERWRENEPLSILLPPEHLMCCPRASGAAPVGEET